MRVSYGPPAQRGVTHLMAVGADDVDQSPTDHAIKRGIMASLGALVLGTVLDAPLLRDMGAGAAVALVAVRFASGAMGSTVAVTQPAASSATPPIVVQIGTAPSPAPTSDYVMQSKGDGWF